MECHNSCGISSTELGDYLYLFLRGFCIFVIRYFRMLRKYLKKIEVTRGQWTKYKLRLAIQK